MLLTLVGVGAVYVSCRAVIKIGPVVIKQGNWLYRKIISTAGKYITFTHTKEENSETGRVSEKKNNKNNDNGKVEQDKKEKTNPTGKRVKDVQKNYVRKGL